MVRQHRPLEPNTHSASQNGGEEQTEPAACVTDSLPSAVDGGGAAAQKEKLSRRSARKWMCGGKISALVGAKPGAETVKVNHNENLRCTFEDKFLQTQSTVESSLVRAADAIALSVIREERRG